MGIREDWKAAEEAVARDRLAKLGDLYFIRCGRAVKIGRTTNIVNRLANMQANTPHEIDCLLLLKGLGHQEKLWHETFAHLRIRGEWFRLDEELTSIIGEHCAGTSVPTDPLATDAENG